MALTKLTDKQVTYKPGFTDSTPRDIGDRLREIVSVKDFAAAGDGVTNDAPAIIAALTYAVANTPCKLVFPSARYKLDTVLGSFSGSDIEIDLQGSALDFSGLSLASTGPLLEFAGTYDATAALTSNGVVASKDMAVNSAGFAVGNMVRVYSTAVWDSTYASPTRIGEISFIESVPDGVSVALTTELQTGYATADSATLQKLTPVRNVTIRNGSIIGPTGNDELIGLRIRLGVACLIENVKSIDVDKVHIQLTDCVFSKVSKCHLEQSNHSSQAYGVSFADACQDCTAVDNSFVDVRHSLSTNNNVSASYGIVRRVLFSNNVISDSAKATGGSGGDAIDTHPGADDIFIVGNTVNSSSNYGINFQARTGSVSGNFIRNTASGGIYINPRADSAGSITVANNALLNIGNASSEYGILVIAQTADIVNLIINGNRVVSFAQPIRAVGLTTHSITGIAVTGNTAIVSAASTTTNGIELSRCARAAVSGNSVRAFSVGILLEDCSNAAVTGNSAEINGDTGANGWGVRISGGDHNSISGNSLYYSSTGLVSTIGVAFSSTVTYSGAWSNVTQGFTTPVAVGAGVGNVEANNL